MCACVCVCSMVYTECTPGICPCGEQCSNQRIQRHQSAVKFDKFLTLNRGFGVKTVNAIHSGVQPGIFYLYYKFSEPFPLITQNSYGALLLLIDSCRSLHAGIGTDVIILSTTVRDLGIYIDANLRMQIFYPTRL